jgi:hypothetical protein
MPSRSTRAGRSPPHLATGQASRVRAVRRPVPWWYARGIGTGGGPPRARKSGSSVGVASVRCVWGGWRAAGRRGLGASASSRALAPTPPRTPTGRTSRPARGCRRLSVRERTPRPRRASTDFNARRGLQARRKETVGGGGGDATRMRTYSYAIRCTATPTLGRAGPTTPHGGPRLGRPLPPA